MNIVKGQVQTIYIKDIGNGLYETVFPPISNVNKFYSLSTTELDEDGNVVGKFFFQPETILASQIQPKTVSLISQNPIGLIPSGTATIFVNEERIDIIFVSTANVSDMVNVINAAVTSKLGQDFSTFASVYITDRIKLENPTLESGSIIIEENSIMDRFLHIVAGEYYGDLPLSYRSYVRDEPFILQNETIPLIKQNKLLDYVSEFDRNLIETNIRTKLLFDGLSYMFSRIDDEMTRFVDQIDLSKIDTKNIEYLAYLFGIDLEKLANSQDEPVSAREILRSLMKIIQIKGTHASFNLILRFLGLSSSVQEVRPNDSYIDDTITEVIIQDFYDRYLLKDSLYRNPILSYGSFVNVAADLPTEGYENEVIRAITDDRIYKYGEGNWNEIFSSTNRIFGLGTEPEIDLDFRFLHINKPLERKTVKTYSDLRILSGFDIVPATTNEIGQGLYEYDNDIPSLNAQIISTVAGPYDLSNLANRQLSLLVNNEYVYEIDFNEYENIITDYESVTVEELKAIIEIHFNQLVALNDGFDRLVIRSKRSGAISSIRVLDGNSALGFSTGLLDKINRTITHFMVKAGTANPSDEEIAIPQITAATDTLVRLETETHLDLLDGIYNVYIHKDGDLIFTSDQKFFGSIFDVGYGWVSKQFISTDAALIGYFQVINRDIAFVVQGDRQSDYKPDLSLTTAQQTAIRAFLRSKQTVANRPGSSTIIGENSLPTPAPFYLRTGERNTTGQPNEPGMENEVVLNTAPINPDTFILTNDIIKQTLEFIEYVRPVHILLLSLIFNVPPLIDSWPKAIHRTQDGDYMPGFWDGTNTVLQSTETFVGAGSTYTVNMKHFKTSTGLSATGSDVIIIKRVGIVLTTLVSGIDYTIDAELGTINLTVALLSGETIQVTYYHTDGKFPWQLDIVERLTTAFSLQDSWFTEGEVNPTTPENDSKWTIAERNNKMRTDFFVENFSNGLGTIIYELFWLGGLANWNTTKILGQVSFSPTLGMITHSVGHLINVYQNVTAGEQIIINGNAYQFDGALLAAGFTNIAIGVSATVTLDNLEAQLIADAVDYTRVENYLWLKNSHVRSKKPVNPPLAAVFAPDIENSLTSWEISDYNPLKKPMVNEYLACIPWANFYENQSVANVNTRFSVEDLSNPGNFLYATAEIPYYDNSVHIHHGHTREIPVVGTSSLDPTDTTPETFSENVYFYGANSLPGVTPYTGSEPYWTQGALYTAEDVRQGIPYYYGSESWDGGSNGQQIQINNNNYQDTGIEHYRNQGMRDGAVVAIIDWTTPPTNPEIITKYILGGIDIEEGKTITTLIADYYNGGAPTNDLKLVIF